MEAIVYDTCNLNSLTLTGQKKIYIIISRRTLVLLLIRKQSRGGGWEKL